VGRIPDARGVRARPGWRSLDGRRDADAKRRRMHSFGHGYGPRSPRQRLQDVVQGGRRRRLDVTVRRRRPEDELERDNRATNVPCRKSGSRARVRKSSSARAS
jgi:hypothetical protein